MLNEIVVVKVSAFQREGSLADKNGMANVYLTALAGKIPNKALVVAGTVAERAGLEIGKTCMVMITERDPDPQYGRQFNHTVIGEVEPSQILGYIKELGKSVVLDVNTSVANNGNTNALNTSALPANQEGATPKLGETTNLVEHETVDEEQLV